MSIEINIFRGAEDKPSTSANVAPGEAMLIFDPTLERTSVFAIQCNPADLGGVVFLIDSADRADAESGAIGEKGLHPSNRIAEIATAEAFKYDFHIDIDGTKTPAQLIVRHVAQIDLN